MTPEQTEQVAAVVATRHAARRDVATARTALEIVQAMNAMVEATPWQPGDVELDDELELVAGAVHLLARRAVERRRELEENPLRHVGSAAAELARSCAEGQIDMHVTTPPLPVRQGDRDTIDRGE